MKAALRPVLIRQPWPRRSGVGTKRTCQGVCECASVGKIGLDLIRSFHIESRLDAFEVFLLLCEVLMLDTNALSTAR